MKGGLDAEMERLFQLPLADFTAARNALAKGAGKRADEVRALAKPPVAAWAVNQLYWRRRDVYDALIEAAADARRAHAAVLSGRAADVRAAGKEHDLRVSAALDAALEQLQQGGHPATDATRQAIVTTLRALPADESPGMLTRVLQPGGFEALAGLSIKSATGSAVVRHAPKPAPKPAAAGTHKESARDIKARERAREALEAATRISKEADHAAQREEFEHARAVREADKAAKEVDAARQALEDAQDALKKAEGLAAVAAKKKEAAERRVTAAEEAAGAARTHMNEARATVDAL